ncbi:DUF1674-domain-containing protein [Xylariaceae sp. FL0594]|nr:DUF1674-domain-containing protein [Xylariaceae sp. FL0594]
MATRLTRLRLARPLSQIQLQLRPSSIQPQTTTPLRPFSQSAIRLSSSSSPDPNPPSPFTTGPSPPRLPPSEQAEFERLQRIASTQEGFNASTTPPTLSSQTSTPTPTESEEPTPLRKGAPPEFEGDVNPKTGEVGGPKNEPLRWGARGDYSFNGRVTDF